MKRMALVIVIAGAAALVGAVWWKNGTMDDRKLSSSTLAQDQEGSKPKEGYNAPGFTLKGINEAEYSIGGPRSKPVLLNFWASWCGPCDMEAPDLQALYEKYGDQIDFYGVNATSYDRERDARAFVEEKKLTFPIPMDREGEVIKLYKVSNFPTSLLIAPDGKVIERITGLITRSDWEQKLSRIIGTPAP